MSADNVITLLMLLTRGSYLHVTCWSVCDQDQNFWLVNGVLDHLIVPFWTSWFLEPEHHHIAVCLLLPKSTCSLEAINKRPCPPLFGAAAPCNQGDLRSFPNRGRVEIRLYNMCTLSTHITEDVTCSDSCLPQILRDNLDLRQHWVTLDNYITWSHHIVV